MKIYLCPFCKIRQDKDGDINLTMLCKVICNSCKKIFNVSDLIIEYLTS